MKKVIAVLTCLLVLSGCGSGITQSVYDALQAENTELKQQLSAYENKHDYEEEYNELISENQALKQQLEEYEGNAEEEMVTPPKPDEASIPSQPSGDPSPETDFVYVNNGSEVQINGYQGPGGYVVIPDEIEGSTVTRIAANAFKDATSITGISLPSQLQYIGDSAFYRLDGLTGVLVLPETIEEVDGHAFQATNITGLVVRSDCLLQVNAFANNSSLEFIYVVDGCSPVVKTAVFGYDTSLTTAVFPSSMSNITDETFEVCNSLTIYTPSGAYAEEYANRNFIQVDTQSFEDLNATYEAEYGITNANENSTGENQDNDKQPTDGTLGEPSNLVGAVEQTYQDAISATKADLTGSKGEWYYKGIPLLSEDCEWIDNPINTDGTVSQGVVYRKIAKMLWGSDFENKRFLYSYKDISDLLLGFVPDTVDEYVELAQEASTFIVTDDQLNAIMRKFQTLDSTDGTFDFNYGKFGKYDFYISDLSLCASEMKISDEMLGFIFAMLDEYAVEITFNGNSCNIRYESSM